MGCTSTAASSVSFGVSVFDTCTHERKMLILSLMVIASCRSVDGSVGGKALVEGSKRTSR